MLSNEFEAIFIKNHQDLIALNCNALCNALQNKTLNKESAEVINSTIFLKNNIHIKCISFLITSILINSHIYYYDHIYILA